MMDTLIRDINVRWGLGDQGRALVQMIVAYMSNPATSGLDGFLGKFRQAGLGGVANSWLGGSGQRELLTTTQVHDVLGERGGLVEQIASRLGLSTDKVLGAVAAVLPALIAKMTPDGNVPAALPAEFTAMAHEGHTLLSGGGLAATAESTSAAAVPAVTGNSMGKWLPWVIGALVVVFGLSYCNKDRNTVASNSSSPPASVAAPSVQIPMPVTTPAPVSTLPAESGESMGLGALGTAPSGSAAVVSSVPGADSTLLVSTPEGAGVMSDVMDGMPVLRVFFDTGKSDVPSQFASKSTALVDFLKSNPDVQAVVSGFNDATGDAARNAELSKQRAQAVKAALESASVAADRVVLEKPTQTDGTGATNASSRRVDVMLRR